MATPEVPKSNPNAKLFVGNLAFSTTSESLAKLFEPVAPVAHVNIIYRESARFGAYSLGYGFVDMKNESDAPKVVAALDKKEVDGRKINVELARPLVLRQPGERRPSRPRGARRSRGAPASSSTSSASSSSSPSSAPPPTTSAETRPRRRRGGRGGSRGGRGPRAGEDAPLSNNRVFITNLPFSTTDNELMELFKTFAPKSAHVIMGFGNRSRGFGFVEVDPSQQAKAIETMTGKKVGDREIICRVARELTAPPKATTATTSTTNTGKQ